MNDFLTLIATPIAIAIFNVVAFAGALTLAFVITQAENDWHLRRTDRPVIQRQRKIAFYSDAALLLLLMCFQRYWLYDPSIMSVALVVSSVIGGGLWLLVINAISLRERQPRPPTRGASASVARSLRHIVSMIRRDL